MVCVCAAEGVELLGVGEEELGRVLVLSKEGKDKGSKAPFV